MLDVKPLDRGFNVAVNHIASRVLPCGFDVSDNAPNDFESLIAHYYRTGRILVWDGASDNTIFACPNTNYAFRAWHDSKHILHNLPFTRSGEWRACEYQVADILTIYDGAIADRFVEMLRAEIIGQYDYSRIHGGFPIDQFGFVQACLDDPAKAYHGDFGVC